MAAPSIPRRARCPEQDLRVERLGRVPLSLDALVPAGDRGVGGGRPQAYLVSFDYVTFLTVWGPVVKRLGFKMVPHEAQHSGPSIDAALAVRTREDIQKRGR